MDNYLNRAEEAAEYAWRMFLDYCDWSGNDPYADGAFEGWAADGRP